MDINDLKVQASEGYTNSIVRLANEPNSKNEYGLKRMTARELKEYLMRPSLLIYDKFNSLVDILSGLDENDEITRDSILGLVHTGIPQMPTLYDLVVAIRDADGVFLDYVSAGDSMSLREFIDSKQDELISGVNFKTVREEDLLGAGNVETARVFIHAAEPYQPLVGDLWISPAAETNPDSTFGKVTYIEAVYDGVVNCGVDFATAKAYISNDTYIVVRMLISGDTKYFPIMVDAETYINFVSAGQTLTLANDDSWTLS